MSETNLQFHPQNTKPFMDQPLQAQSLTIEEIQDWLISQIALQLGVDSDEIDLRSPFSSYGLGSLQATSIAELGKQQLGVQLSPLVIWNFPNVESLAAFLAEELAASDTELFEL